MLKYYGRTAENYDLQYFQTKKTEPTDTIFKLSKWCRSHFQISIMVQIIGFPTFFLRDSAKIL